MKSGDLRTSGHRGSLWCVFRTFPRLRSPRPVIREWCGVPIDPIDDDVIFGQCYPRRGALPIAASRRSTPVSRARSGTAARSPLRLGGYQAGSTARCACQTGAAELVIAGGAESMSQVGI